MLKGRGIPLLGLRMVKNEGKMEVKISLECLQSRSQERWHVLI